MPPPGDGTYVNTITRNGRTICYLRISAGPQRDRYVHQLVAEAMLGRPLLPYEEVDHKDEDTLNNDWRNLQVIPVGPHAKLTRTRATRRRLAQQRAADQAAARETYEAYRALQEDLPPVDPAYTPEPDED